MLGKVGGEECWVSDRRGMFGKGRKGLLGKGEERNVG